jgi:hypothetical protein
MQGTILSQITGTSLGPSGYAPQKPVHGTSLGSTGYVSSSLKQQPTVLGAGTGPTYAETSFKAASSYRPPLTRQPAPSLGFAGGGTIPGGNVPLPPPIGYFEYQGNVTYFDVIGGVEYFITQ